MPSWHEGGFVLDTRDQINAFALMQVHRKLKMEVDRPNGPRWHGSPMKQAIAIMASCGVECRHRTKKNVLAQYETFLKEAGLPV
jgi:hypothetical protein